MTAQVGVMPVGVANEMVKSAVGLIVLLEIHLNDKSGNAKIRRLHNEIGTFVDSDGVEWEGVTDPSGARLLTISDLRDAHTNEAKTIDFALSGIDIEFYKGMKEDARLIGGSKANLYIQALASRHQALGPKVVFIEGGVLSPPALASAREQLDDGSGKVSRQVNLILENRYVAGGFASGLTYSSSSQKLLYPDDKFFDAVGTDLIEKWPRKP